MGGMVSRCELLINVVKYVPAKDAVRLEPKGKVAGTGSVAFPVMGNQRYRRREST
jgi:hypothetical protein